MADPVSTSDGFSYEREAIAEWFAGGHKTSPLTGAPLDRADLVPNHTLRAAIQEYVNAHPEIGQEVYRPRDSGAIRQTINSRQWATPQDQPLYPETSVTPMGQHVYPQGDGATQQVAIAQPVGLPMATPIGIVQAPPPAPLNGLTADDHATTSGYAVPDWAAFVTPPKKASGGWFGSSTKAAEPHPDEPKLRLVPAAHGGVSSAAGVTLEATVTSEAQLQRLSCRLAANGTAPVAALRITAQEGDGFGILVDNFHGEGPAFGLLTRALHAASGAGAPALRGLLELSITRLPIQASPAAALATALRGHCALQKLELWNCAIDDDGAMCLGRLAAVDGNLALRELNLGRSLVSGTCREHLEAVVDRDRVHAKLY
eukprot:CAMPEP_0115850902 /NCGR_PEP_ID=MMETSP0287-20121206/12203_1 /TAXON_ID=412157 /ORGANISM="Chrysochromulina rotalis, Strain UIO044" /LENGTH=371 /DNA_ID=CAMNT_0003304913 /DNA_START=75 /DNA_END=1190 /DNA_ORIENTATION=+